MFILVRTLGFGRRVLLSFHIPNLAFSNTHELILTPDLTKRELHFGDLLFHLLLPTHEEKMTLQQSNSNSIKMDFFLSAQLARKLYIPCWSYLDGIDCVACAMLLPPIQSQSPTPSLELKKFPHPPLSLQTLITIPTDAKYLQ